MKKLKIPKKPVVVYEFESTVDFHLGSTPHKDKAQRALNMKLAKVEGWPLGVPSSEIPQELIPIHHRMCAVHRMAVIVKVFSDGNLKLEFLNKK